MRCPFVYSDRRQCKGHIVGVEIIRSDLYVSITEDDRVKAVSISPRYHVHLYCSEKGDHAGVKREHSEQMKMWYKELPEWIKKKIEWEDK